MTRADARSDVRQPSVTAAAFDRFAAEYDAGFARNRIGTYMRRHLWTRLREVFRIGDRVVDLGAGTGEDAAYLARLGCRVTCIDVSYEMMALARAKAATAGILSRVSFRLQDMGSPRFCLEPEAFDGAISAFGSLNFLCDLPSFLHQINRGLKDGGWLILMSMNRYAPWDLASRIVRGRPSWIWSRFRGRFVPVRMGSVEVQTRYYSRGEIIRAGESAGFTHQFSESLGCFVPPAYLAESFVCHESLMPVIISIEKALTRFPLVRSFGDFVLIGLRKMSGSN